MAVTLDVIVVLGVPVMVLVGEEVMLVVSEELNEVVIDDVSVDVCEVDKVVLRLDVKVEEMLEVCVLDIVNV